MFDLSNLKYLAEDEIANAKIEKLRVEQEAARNEIEKAKREIEQGENKIKRLLHSQSEEERKARTKRLVERGAIVEKFIPDAETLTNDEVKAILARVFRASS
jgi:uncharacterized coiled-coil DUF342 family protein